MKEETQSMKREREGAIPRAEKEPFLRAAPVEGMLPPQAWTPRSLEEKAPITVPTVVQYLLATVACLLALDAAPAQAQVLDLEKLDGLTAIKMMEEGTLTSVAL